MTNYNGLFYKTYMHINQFTFYLFHSFLINKSLLQNILVFGCKYKFSNHKMAIVYQDYESKEQKALWLRGSFFSAKTLFMCLFGL